MVFLQFFMWFIQEGYQDGGRIRAHSLILGQQIYKNKM